MKIRLLTTLLICGVLAGYGQPPISSVYENIRADRSPFVKAVYELLHRHYQNQLNAPQLAKLLNGLATPSAAREKAIYNMALSYTKTEEEDFGFYNLRSAVNDAETLPGEDVIKGVVFAEFGNYLSARETHDLAIEFLRRSVPLLEKNKPAGLEGSGYSLLNKMLRSFTALGETDSVTVYMDKVIAHAGQYRDKLWLSSACNNKGYRFYEAGKYDSARVWYRLAQTFLDTARWAHLLFYENVNENIAHILAQQYNYAAALRLQEKVIDTRLRFPNEAVFSIRGLNYYAGYCSQTGQPAAALRKFRQSLPLLQASGLKFETSREYLQLRMKLAQMAGDDALYQHYFGLFLEKEKEKLEKEKQLLVNRRGINKFIKSRNELFEKQLEIERLQKARLRQSVSYRNTIIIILAALSVFVLYGIYTRGRYKKRLLEAENEKLAQREQILDLENINLKNNIELKEKDISKVVADNRLRTEIKKEFLKKLEELSGTEEKKMKQEIRLLRSELGQTIDQHDKLNLLQVNIEDINAQFEKKLRATIPAITQSEIEICSLIRLGYNNTDIANITNKTPENVRVNKFRIKQKAGLDDMKELERLLKEV